MKLLALDATAERIVIALYKDGKRDYFSSEKGAKKHNSALLGYIDAFLGRNGIGLSDIDVFGVAVGPGSFTGIRVGVATINAFNLALGKKIVEVTTLEIHKEEWDCLVMLDCKHGNYYCGKFANNEAEYLALSEEEADEVDLPKVYVSETAGEELLEKCLQKAAEGAFTTQAKPFYLKKSSAERETGIEC